MMASPCEIERQGSRLLTANEALRHARASADRRGGPAAGSAGSCCRSEREDPERPTRWIDRDARRGRGNETDQERSPERGDSNRRGAQCSQPSRADRARRLSRGREAAGTPCGESPEGVARHRTGAGVCVSRSGGAPLRPRVRPAPHMAQTKSLGSPFPCARLGPVRCRGATVDARKTVARALRRPRPKRGPLLAPRLAGAMPSPACRVGACRAGRACVQARTPLAAG